MSEDEVTVLNDDSNVEDEEQEEYEYEERKTGYCKDHGFVKAIFKGNRWRCPVCGRIISTDMNKIKKKIEKEARGEVISDEDDEEFSEIYLDDFTKEAIEYLKKNLTKVPGISKSVIKKIIETLELDPNILKNPTLLHMHIKSIARSANVYYLSMLINKMFLKLQPLLEAPELVYYPTFQHPTIPPILNQPVIPPAPAPAPAVPISAPITPVQTQQKKKRTYKVVVDGQVIETDDVQEFLELKRWLDEREKKELEKKKLETEIKRIAGENVQNQTSSDDRLITLINSLQNQLSELMKRNRELESKLISVKEEIKQREWEEIQKKLKEFEEIKKNPVKLIRDLEEQLELIGYSKSNKSLLDIIDSINRNINTTINSLINRLPSTKTSKVKYTVNEREERINKVKEKINKTSDLIELENEIINKAKKIYD